jgi:hypothetical protein
MEMSIKGNLLIIELVEMEKWYLIMEMPIKASL